MTEKKLRNNSNHSGGGSPSPSSSAPSLERGEEEILKSIGSKTSGLLHPLVTLTCYIPTHCVGAVIGKHGSTILNMQRQAREVGNGTMVRVSIVGQSQQTANQTPLQSPSSSNNNNNNPASSSSSNSTNNTHQDQSTTGTTTTTSSVPYTFSKLDMTSPHWTPVVIRADVCGALAAGQLLYKVVEGDMDECILDLSISRSKHAGLIGKRGLVLANLSADTRVRIMVPRKEARHDVVQLEGDLDRVRVCCERILLLLHNNNNNINNSNGNHSVNNHSNNGNSNNNLKRNGIVTFAVGQLPSQTKLRNVGRKTDTVIKKKKLVDEGLWQLIVSGNSHDHIQQAVALLEKWKEEQQKESGSPSSTNAGGAEKNRGSNLGRGGQRGGGGGNNNGRRPKGKGKKNNSVAPTSENPTS